jgi:hypothetical protein
MRPSTRIKVATRAARRRRVGYAALRVLRCGVRAAFVDHKRRTLGDAEYAGTQELEAIARAYPRAVRRLLQRWPNLNFTDPRADP